MTRTQIIQASNSDAVSVAVRVLNEGGIVALPTETVYGLAAAATNQKAVEKIFKAKGRPASNPLICHVEGPDMARQFVHITPLAQTLMTCFWPGPLTIVLPLKEGTKIAKSVTAGLSTLAVRCPDHDFTRPLIQALGAPIAAPSANRSGRLSPTRHKDVVSELDGRLDVIIDGGATIKGVESTIVGIADNSIELLRPGSITLDMLSGACGRIPTVKEHSDTLTAPGQMQSHYAPGAPVRLNASHAREGETLIGFGDQVGDLSLSETGDLEDAASNLFAVLREADAAKPIAIAVVPIPDIGVGLAINDRLRRAAAPRPDTPGKNK